MGCSKIYMGWLENNLKVLGENVKTGWGGPSNDRMQPRKQRVGAL